MDGAMREDIALLTYAIAQHSSNLRQASGVAITHVDHNSLNDATFDDALETFQYWTGHFGAFHDAQDSLSLEHRLRNAPAIRRRMCEVLGELLELLKSGKPNKNYSGVCD